MKKWLPIIAGILLGLLFVMSAVVVLFNLVKAPPPPEGSPAAMFFGAFATTGYLTFVKIFELVGGLFVMIPRLRNFEQKRKSCGFSTSLTNPTWLRMPNVSQTLSAFRFEGRAGAGISIEQVRAEHIGFGPTKTVGGSVQWVATRTERTPI